MNIKLQIETDSAVYNPIVLDGITWTTERKGAPSKLEFTLVKDQNISFPEGSKVGFWVDGTPIFFGFVFEKTRDREKQIKVVAYDQLRYFRNKHTVQYKNKRADEVVKMLADDFKVQVGKLDNTGFKIKARDEDNQTLFDIVLNALDLTFDATKTLYVLYDKFGSITLTKMEDMKVDYLIDSDNTENFDYTSSIDKDTYNKIRVRKENKETGKRDVYEVRDNTAIGNWGVLQYVHDVSGDVTNPKSLANTLLKAKNRKTRDLTLKGVKGDVRVRAGCKIPVHLDLGDMVNDEWLVCESVTHIFSADHHTMDISIYDKWG